LAIITGEIVIGRPVEVVFDFVADQRNELKYNPRLLRSAKVTAGPVGEGTRFAPTPRTAARRHSPRARRRRQRQDHRTDAKFRRQPALPRPPQARHPARTGSSTRPGLANAVFWASTHSADCRPAAPGPNACRSRVLRPGHARAGVGPWTPFLRLHTAREDESYLFLGGETRARSGRAVRAPRRELTLWASAQSEPGRTREGGFQAAGPGPARVTDGPASCGHLRLWPACPRPRMRMASQTPVSMAAPVAATSSEMPR
jgi:hypothetical protein